jgi:multicomponent Na+:H+ antiporter subunit B
MRLAGLVLITALGVLLVWASNDLPLRGDPASPAATHVSAYYIQNALEDSNTPNMVTAVLADYRGFDTFGEAVVVVAAALSCLLILLRRREEEEEETARVGDAGGVGAARGQGDRRGGGGGSGRDESARGEPA